MFNYIAILGSYAVAVALFDMKNFDNRDRKRRLTKKEKEKKTGDSNTGCLSGNIYKPVCSVSQ